MRDIDDEYLLGPRPARRAGDSSRARPRARSTCPRGDWYDWHTGERTTAAAGSWRRRRWTGSRSTRARGAVIPMWPEAPPSTAGHHPARDRAARVRPGADGECDVAAAGGRRAHVRRAAALPAHDVHARRPRRCRRRTEGDGYPEFARERFVVVCEGTRRTVEDREFERDAMTTNWAGNVTYRAARGAAAAHARRAAPDRRCRAEPAGARLRPHVQPPRRRRRAAHAGRAARRRRDRRRLRELQRRPHVRRAGASTWRGARRCTTSPRSRTSPWPARSPPARTAPAPATWPRRCARCSSSPPRATSSRPSAATRTSTAWSCTSAGSAWSRASRSTPSRSTRSRSASSKA